MVRNINKLSARTVETAKPGRHGDGGGLYLIVAETGARKWVYRFTWKGKVTEQGLGNGAVSLKDARAKAEDARKLIAQGINPIQAKQAAAMVEAGRMTFGQCADAYLEAKSFEWRNEKHRAQWRMTLTEYAAPLRKLPVDQVDTMAVLAVLQPIWLQKPETASRLRGRIEMVPDAAKAQGQRSGENPAAWRGHLKMLLPKRTMLSRGHHAALPYRDIPAFVQQLREREAIAALALEFCILTAARSGEVLSATWDEIDFDTKVWSIAAKRMKAGREHRVPLSSHAMAILEKLSSAKSGKYIFLGQRPGRPLSDMSMEMLTRRMRADAVTVHGFRSSFRDWAGEETHFPRELAEAALAHVIGDKAEQAYRRGDALEKRRSLMEAWADFCEPHDSTNVISITAKKDVLSVG